MASGRHFQQKLSKSKEKMQNLLNTHWKLFEDAFTKNTREFRVLLGENKHQNSLSMNQLFKSAGYSCQRTHREQLCWTSLSSCFVETTFAEDAFSVGLKSKGRHYN